MASVLVKNKNLTAGRNKGFTLIELLVVTAVVGVLGVLSATLISSILRSQNKTAIITEVRQNGDLVISKFERDVKQTEEICVPNSAPPPNCVGTGTSVTLRTYTGETITWACDPSPAVGSFDRATSSVINIDPDNGVRVTACGFTVTPLTHTTGVTQIVTVTFTLAQRSDLLRAEYQVSEQFQTTVGTRAY